MVWLLDVRSTSGVLTLSVQLGELCRREICVLGVYTILLESVKQSDRGLGVWTEGNSSDENNRASCCDPLLNNISSVW